MEFHTLQNGVVAGVAMTISGLAVPATAAVVATNTNTNTDVDPKLALLVDVSGSVGQDEFELQRDGYVDAFKSAVVQNSILGGAFKQIAVSLVYWSGGNQQEQTIGWTLIDSVTAPLRLPMPSRMPCARSLTVPRQDRRSGISLMRPAVRIRFPRMPSTAPGM